MGGGGGRDVCWRAGAAWGVFRQQCPTGSLWWTQPVGGPRSGGHKVMAGSVWGGCNVMCAPGMNIILPQLFWWCGGGEAEDP